MLATTQKQAAAEIAPQTINNKYHHDYIPDKPAQVYIDDIGEMYDRQTTVYFVTMTACIVAIITAVVSSR
jgi:anthranilate phosphoribosyltransferase